MAKKAAAQKAALPVGQNVIIRTVTLYYTGKLVAVVDGVYVLDDAAWIADAGRWSEALKSGVLSEVEPYPGRCYVERGAVVDVSPWNHELPRSVK